jgi:hypothetical protein
MRSARRLARLAAFLLRTPRRRQTLPPGAPDEERLALVEDEAETELRREAERLDAVEAAIVPAQEIAVGPDRRN